MRNKLYAIPLLLLFLPSLKVSAQFHFVKATVHFRNGSSMQGWVDQAPLDHFPKYIRFKENESDVSHLFLTPADLYGFELSSGDKFITYVGLVDSATQFEVKGKIKPIPPRSEDSLFLKVIAKGNANFYFTIDRNKIKHFFFKKGDAAIEELHSYTYLYKEEGVNKGIYVSGGTRAVYDKRYKQQLLPAFKDCQSVFEDFADANVNFNKNALNRWFVKYNACPPSAEHGDEKLSGVSK